MSVAGVNYSMRTFVTGTAIAAGSKGKFVELTADNTVSICGAATDKAIGVIPDNDAYATGESVSIITEGEAPVLAGTAGYAFGDYVGTDANGAGVVKSVLTNVVAGVCVIGASAGEIGTVLLKFFTLAV